MFTIALTLGLLGQVSPVGPPPRNASPELRAMYAQVDADHGIRPQEPPPIVARPWQQAMIRQDVLRHKPPVVDDARRQRRQQWNRQYLNAVARQQFENSIRQEYQARVYAYMTTPEYVHVTSDSRGGYSTYYSTPGGFTRFQSVTPGYLTNVPDVYTSQSQAYRPY